MPEFTQNFNKLFLFVLFNSTLNVILLNIINVGIYWGSYKTYDWMQQFSFLSEISEIIFSFSRIALPIAFLTYLGVAYFSWKWLFKKEALKVNVEHVV